jgi:hypothetical protein
VVAVEPEVLVVTEAFEATALKTKTRKLFKTYRVLNIHVFRI